MIRPYLTRRDKLQELTPERPDYVPGLLQVKIKDDVTEEVPDIKAMTARSIKGLQLPQQVDEPFKQLRQQKAIKQVTPVFSRSTEGEPLSRGVRSLAAAFATSIRDSETEALRGINLLELSKSTDLEKVEKDLKSNPGVEYVHRIPARWAAAKKKPSSQAQAAALSSHNRQWGLRAIRWFDIKPMPDASMVKVAVLDTGIDTTHPNFDGVNIHYDHEGAIASDIVGHGTHVSGIIAALPKDELSVTGMCQCELHVWKIFKDSPDKDGEYYINEIRYQRALDAASKSQMQVVNLSIGGFSSSTTEELLISRLIQGGAIVVAAMGNEFMQRRNPNPIEYPAAYRGVVAVGAIDPTNRRAGFSNTGNHITLAAPGTGILSTLPMKASAYRNQDETEYGAWDGTSMATPHVTAGVALLLAKNSGASRDKIIGKLQSSSQRVPDMKKSKKTKEFGAGLLDMQAALS
jgi:subtilisin family serine protease